VFKSDFHEFIHRAVFLALSFIMVSKESLKCLIFTENFFGMFNDFIARSYHMLPPFTVCVLCRNTQGVLQINYSAAAKKLINKTTRK